jgi:outer membrane protein assembly factor BamB
MSRSLLLVALFASSVQAENWPGWRGPRGDGTSTEKNLPTEWSTTKNVKWKLKLPSPGNSSPVVWGDRVFLTQSIDKAGTERALFCIDRKSGTVLWQKSIPFKDKEPTHATNPYCAATPVTDGEIVIASHGSAGLVCYDFSGNQLWHRDLGLFIHIWGTAASPILYGDLVILNCGPGERTSLRAFDKKTGKDVWEVPEPGGKAGNSQADWIGSWSTPRIVNVDGKDQLVMSWPNVLKAHDPKSGKMLWSCKGLTKLVYTSPVTDGKYVVAMSGYGGAAIGLKLGGTGDVTETNRLWHHNKSNPQRIGSGVIVGDHFYMANANANTIQCIELKTGKDLWEKQTLGVACWGSLVLADGKLYTTDQNGDTFVLDAKPKFELVARNKLGEHCNASPAISDGEIFLRTFQHLWCIAEKK